MIYAIVGMPGDGKSFYATRMAIDEWKKNKDKRIFSNFPILWKDCSSYIWKDEYVKEDIFDCMIIIDEAWMAFSSRNWNKFSEDEHLMFATNRHNGLDIVVISQSIQRLDTVIREITNQIYLIRKFEIPFLGKPLWFKVEAYDSVDALKQRYVSKDSLYKSFRVRFTKEIADAYNTHQYRKPDKEPFEPVLWFPEVMEQRKRRKSVITRLFRVVGLGRSNSVPHPRPADKPTILRDKDYDLYESRGIVKEFKQFLRFYYRLIFRRRRKEEKGCTKVSSVK